MSSPLSHKRLCTTPVEVADAMEGVVNTVAVQDMNFGFMEASEEIRSSGNLSHAQDRPQGWLTSLDSKEVMLPWPNLGCTGKLSVSHPVLASYGGHFLGPGC
eukprot:c20992_g1_i1 orf=649-954(+)